MASRALSFISRRILDGKARTTTEIDSQLHDWIIANNCYPSPLGYRGFPRSCCTSVNNIVAHGIPGYSEPVERTLESTDLINVDVTLFTSDGVHGDTSHTIILPDVDPIGRTLVEVTEGALEEGIRTCGPGVPYKEIGRRIERFLAKEENGGGRIKVVKGLNGHGIGRVFHRSPWILHDCTRFLLCSFPESN
jgi:methionyl aminopeptidase